MSETLSSRIRCGNSTPAEDAIANASPDLFAALSSFPSLPCIEDMDADAMADKLREISAWQSDDCESAKRKAGRS
jgi:hypothetical protein